MEIVILYTGPYVGFHMAGYQNYGPILDPLDTRVPYCSKEPKRDHDFYNYPYTILGLCWDMVYGPVLLVHSVLEVGRRA